MKTNKYIKPEIEIIIVEMQGVIATSDQINASETVEDDIILRGNKRSFWKE